MSFVDLFFLFVIVILILYVTLGWGDD